MQLVVTTRAQKAIIFACLVAGLLASVLAMWVYHARLNTEPLELIGGVRLYFLRADIVLDFPSHTYYALSVLDAFFIFVGLMLAVIAITALRRKTSPTFAVVGKPIDITAAIVRRGAGEPHD